MKFVDEHEMILCSTGAIAVEFLRIIREMGYPDHITRLNVVHAFELRVLDPELYVYLKMAFG
jgi:hypothetical protein